MIKNKKILEKEAFFGRPKFNNFVRNKKALGFGKLFLILCLVLFGLTLWFFTLADQRINTCIGTEELDKISSKNLEFYFFDSMRLATSDFIKEATDYSFIDPDNNANCQLTSGNVVILNSDCKPNEEILKIRAVDKIKEDVNDSLKKIKIENDVSCLFEKNKKINFLRCYSKDINLSSKRNGEFFRYTISHKFNLNETINFDEQINLSEISEIYLASENCQNVNCQIISKEWDVKEIKEEENYLIFSLKTKKEYPFEDKIEKISWKFAIKT